MASLIRSRFERTFLLKAHGSVRGGGELVLTGETYRNLMFASPSYRAFVQTLLADFQMLFVGSGLSDPDFDGFLDSMHGQFGDPVHRHVAVFGPDADERQSVLLRKRYGINVLRLDSYDSLVPTLRLAASTETEGPAFRSTLDLCVDSDLDKRSDGHRLLARLGPAGKRTASAALLRKLNRFESEGSYWEVAECAFSLGALDANMNRSALIEVAERTNQAEVIGRVLTVLRSALTPLDLTRLRVWRERFEKTPADGANPERLLIYIDYLLAYVPAKYASNPI